MTLLERIHQLGYDAEGMPLCLRDEITLDDLPFTRCDGCWSLSRFVEKTDLGEFCDRCLCSVCDGDGCCPECSGDGVVECDCDEDDCDDGHDCSECDGYGACDGCDGEGHVGAKRLQDDEVLTKYLKGMIQ